VVIGFHVLLFLTVRPAFFAMFKKTVTSASEGSQGEPFAPAAIFTIPIEIEDQPNEKQDPVQDALDPAERERKKKDRQPQPNVVVGKTVPAEDSRQTDAPIDIENLIGESPETLPHNIGKEEIMIPPRALEITWPDTRNLEHCLGHHIDLKIEVNERGEIMTIEPLDTNHPVDCIRVAVESAGRIVFEPGQIDGHPSPMWTQVRIEFRKAQ